MQTEMKQKIAADKKTAAIRKIKTLQRRCELLNEIVKQSVSDSQEERMALLALVKSQEVLINILIEL